MRFPETIPARLSSNFLHVVAWLTIVLAILGALPGAAEGMSQVVWAGLGGVASGSLLPALGVAVEKAQI